MSAAVDYCPTCADTVVPDSHGRCAWCGDMCRVAPKVGGKRPGDHLSAITPHLLDVAHAMYERGASMPQIAEAIIEHTTYANVDAAVASLYKAFRIRGWKLRDRSAAADARGITKHGRARRADRHSAEHLAYRREQDRARNAARRGQCPADGCGRLAIEGRDHCHIHDPQAAGARIANIERGRARRNARMLRWGDVGGPILDWARTQRYPAMRLAERSGVPEATCRKKLAANADEPITPELLQRLLDGITTNPTAEAATTESAAS